MGTNMYKKIQQGHQDIEMQMSLTSSRTSSCYRTL